MVNTARGIWGAELSLLTIVHQLALAGTSVDVMASAPLLLDKATAGAPVRGVPLTPRAGRLRKNLSVLIPLARVPRGSTIVTWDVDLVLALVLLRPLFRLRRISTALDLHIMLSGRLTPRLTRLLVRWLDTCIAISHFVAAQVSANVATHVVQRPVLVHDAPLPAAPSPDLRVGVVGRIDREKRIEFAFAALAAMTTPAVLIVRGGGFLDGVAYLEELKLLAQEAAFECHFEAAVPQTESMVGLDVLLHCNATEPAGRVIQEAQLAGVVPVVPNQGGAPEFVQDGVTGLTYRSGAPSDAARQLDRLNGTGLRSRVGAAAKEHARESYDPKRQAIRYLRALASPLRGDPL